MLVRALLAHEFVTWLEQASWEIVGEGCGPSCEAGTKFFENWLRIIDASKGCEAAPASELFLNGVPQRSTFALCELFRLRDRRGRTLHIQHPSTDAELLTDEMPVGWVPLDDGQSMLFEYDFGARWMFDVRLERVDMAPAQTPAPRIVESHGEAPREYDFGYDDEYDYDDYDDADEGD